MVYSEPATSLLRLNHFENKVSAQMSFRRDDRDEVDVVKAESSELKWENQQTKLKIQAI
jgi:hypothetical protein